MELTIQRKEIIGNEHNNIVNNKDIYTYELMDGCPLNGEEIPIRLYLKGVQGLT